LSLILILILFIHSRNNKLYNFLGILSIILLTDDRGILTNSGDPFLVNGIFHSKILLLFYILLLLFDVVIQNYFKLSKEFFRFLLINLYLIFVGFLIFMIDPEFKTISRVLHDVSYFIFPIIALFFWHLKLKKLSNFDLNRLIKGFVILISFEILFYFILFIFGVGYERGGLITVSFDTGKKLFPFYSILLYAFFLKFKSSKTKKLLFILFIISIIVNMSFASRSSLLLLIVFFIYVTYMNFGYARGLLYSSFISLIIVLFVFINQDQFSFVLWKLNTITFDPNSTSTSGAVRFISLLNIWSEMDIINYFFGKGFSGYFTESYINFPFNLDNRNAFSDYEISTGRYYKPHTTPIFMLLKIGLLGTIIFSYNILYYLKKLLRKNNDFLIRIFSLLTIILVLNVYSSKIQLLTGFFVALFIEFINRKNNESTEIIKVLE
tara:strand:+ start:575 stop:1885 length:1311 start_codon:yes stop_codon:yes gene_type:complete